MYCTEAHTKYQPTEEEFVCPKCGTHAPDFCIYDSEAGDNCELLHKADYLQCEKCGYGITGSAFVKRIMKQKDLVACPCCKGTGFVTKKEQTNGNE